MYSIICEIANIITYWITGLDNDSLNIFELSTYLYTYTKVENVVSVVVWVMVGTCILAGIMVIHNHFTKNKNGLTEKD